MAKNDGLTTTAYIRDILIHNLLPFQAPIDIRRVSHIFSYTYTQNFAEVEIINLNCMDSADNESLMLSEQPKSNFNY